MKKDESPNLFAHHPTNCSPLYPDRNVSDYRGTVFKVVYEDKFKMASRRTLIGRLMDIQAVYESGRAVGIKMLYKIGRWSKSYDWTEDQEVKEAEFGPFDTVSSIKPEMAEKDGKDNPIPPHLMLHFHEMPCWALQHSQPGDVDHRMLLTLMTGT